MMCSHIKQMTYHADDICKLGSNNTSNNPQADDTFEAPEQSMYVQRNKSTGNLLSKTQETADRGRVRYSIDAGTAQELNVAK
jgi:hypothetical protein